MNKESSREKWNRYMKKWRENNKEKIRKLSKQYRQTHRNKIRKLMRKWKIKNREKLKILKSQLREKNKIKAVNLFGGKCKICGYNKSFVALDFHHFLGREDRSNKIKMSSLMMGKWGKLEEELRKCILLCANCHREIHYPNKNI